MPQKTLRGGVWITVFWSFWLQAQVFIPMLGWLQRASQSPGPSAHSLKPWPSLLCHFSGRFQDPGATGEEERETNAPLLHLLLSGKGAILQAATPSRQEADSPSALGHNCSDRFISSRVPAIRCKTWAFVSRGKAAAKRLLDTLSERPGAGFLGEVPTWPSPLRYSLLLIFSHSPNPNLLSPQTLFRDRFFWLLHCAWARSRAESPDGTPPRTRCGVSEAMGPRLLLPAQLH